jgi:hypothetical protein
MTKRNSTGSQGFNCKLPSKMLVEREQQLHVLASIIPSRIATTDWPHGVSPGDVCENANHVEMVPGRSSQASSVFSLLQKLPSA